MATSVTTDEIYERYLRKAITEINRLSQEIAQAADGAATALPTGHPLANIFLLKYGPQAQELQEGVAFHGRAGAALIKSLQRLEVDPMEVYGTNCVKFAGCDLGVAADWLRRELRIVEPKLLVVMGEDALEFLNGIGFPLSTPIESKLGELQRFSPTIEALAVPDIDLALDEAPRRPPFGTPSKPWAPGGPLCLPTESRARRGAAFLGLFAALVVYYETSTHLWNWGLWGDVAWIALVLIPAVFGLVLLALPLRVARGLLPVGIAFAVLAAVLTYADINVFANFARLGAATLIGWWFLGYFETLSWVVLVAAIIPWVDAYSVWRGPTKHIVEHHEHVFSVLSFAFPVPGEHSAANLGIPDLLFFALFLAASDRFGLRVYATWLTLVAALGGTIALTVWLELSGLPALPAIALGFLVPNADLLWRRLRGEPGIGDRTDVAVDAPPNDA